MKFSPTCIVFAAFAAAAAPVRADSPVSKTESAPGDTFSRLIKTQVLIKSVKKRNDDFLLPALNEISRELHQGLDADIYQIGSRIGNTLVDVNRNVELISGNVTSMILQIEHVAHNFSTLHSSDARLDYDKKKHRIQKLCEDTLAMTKVVVQLIDETKETLAKGVSGPLEKLQLTIQLASDHMLREKEKDIKGLQLLPIMFINSFGIGMAPLLIAGLHTDNMVKALIREGPVSIERIQKLVTSILNHAKWLGGACLTIREDLDKDRATLSVIEGKISGTSGSVTMIADNFDFLFSDRRNMSDDYLREGSKAMVQMMDNLRAQVFSITRDHARRAAWSYY